MGRLKNLLSYSTVRIWLITVAPISFIFLFSALGVRMIVRDRLARFDFADGRLVQSFNETFQGGYIAWGFVAALLVSTLLAIVAMRVAQRPIREVGRVARELAQGNYVVRVHLRKVDSHLDRQLAADVNALAESLERTERLRRSLVSNLAHEIRTPLTNLQGYLEAMRDGIIEPKQEALESVHDEVLRLVRLVDALHQLARADAVRHQPMERTSTLLDNLADQLIRVMMPTADAKGIQVSLDLGANGVLVPIHADSMAQVIRNLLRNAVQYTSEDGVIQISSQVFEGSYRFTCANSGPGVAPSDLPLIFQRFYRTERSVGAGLGLAIVKELVEANGGRIVAESRPGWTLFRFEIPLQSRDII